MIWRQRAQIRQAAHEAGGQLKVYHNSKYQLLLDGSGHLLYQPLSSNTGAKKVRWWRFFRSHKVPELSGEALASAIQNQLSTTRSKRALIPMAILPSGKEVPPDTWAGGYHGSSKIPPQVALRQGLPATGDDRRLREHSEPSSDRQRGSAFRGVTNIPSDPVSENGAAYWAGKGGWVYEIRGVPSWNVNTNLFGRVKTLKGFRGNLMHAEQEIAIPAQVSPDRIKAYGVVEEGASGKLLVKRWIPNPGFKPNASTSTSTGGPRP